MRTLTWCVGIPTLPRMLAHARMVQTNTGPFPGGILYVIVTNKIRGKPLDQIHDLSPVEVDIIRDQLARTI
jgi:hypothetical protein